MAFPSSIDSPKTNWIPGETRTNHSAQHNMIGNLLIAMQNKIGVDSSAVTTSLDYIVQNNNPDFYKYSITRTVVGGNITVSLKNFEGNDPTSTKPVKRMIGGVLRTITSSKSFVMNAGTNWMDLGSSVLATKEVDLFVYLAYSTTLSTVVLAGCRRSDYINGTTNGFATTDRRFMQTVGGAGSIPDATVIGRFNAILSAGAGYSWSIPGTSIIIHEPIYETRWLECAPTIIYNGTTPSGSETIDTKYKINYDSCFLSYHQEWTVAGVGNTIVTASLPMQERTSFFADGLYGGINVGSGSGYGVANGSTVQCRGGSIRVNGTSINANTFIVGGSYLL